jgi:hypothetical protein
LMLRIHCRALHICLLGASYDTVADCEVLQEMNLTTAFLNGKS